MTTTCNIQIITWLFSPLALNLLLKIYLSFWFLDYFLLAWIVLSVLTFLLTKGLCNSAQLAPLSRALCVPYWDSALQAEPHHTLYWSYITVPYITCLHSGRGLALPNSTASIKSLSRPKTTIFKLHCTMQCLEFIISSRRLLSEKLSNMIFVHLAHPLPKLQTDI